MIKNRGIIQLGGGSETGPTEQIVVIEAFEQSERQRVHELMTEDWVLISLARRRTAEGAAYTEYRLRAPRSGVAAG